MLSFKIPPHNYGSTKFSTKVSSKYFRADNSDPERDEITPENGGLTPWGTVNIIMSIVLNEIVTFSELFLDVIVYRAPFEASDS